MPSDCYCLIWEAARGRRQITCTYDGFHREACPVILGYSVDGEEKVFVYQFAGQSSRANAKLPQWRCLDVDEMRDLKSRNGPWFEGVSHKQAQSCVRFVDIDVNVPETLERTAPLAFGSPLLRPPRRSG